MCATRQQRRVCDACCDTDFCYAIMEQHIQRSLFGEAARIYIYIYICAYMTREIALLRAMLSYYYFLYIASSILR